MSTMWPQYMCWNHLDSMLHLLASDQQAVVYRYQQHQHKHRHACYRCMKHVV